MQNLQYAIEMIKADEGYASKPYKDTRGLLTIGWGRCLQTRGITKTEAGILLQNDSDGVVSDLGEQAFWPKTDPVRQVVLFNMGFNLGVHGLLGFKDFLVALEGQFWTKAADAMLDSEWAQEVGQRAQRLAQIIRSGQI